MPQFVLIGLVDPPSDAEQAAFDEWFIGQHIEDTTHCPNFIRGRVFKLSGPHRGSEAVSGYLSIYEVEADSYAEAEQVLNAWQEDADAWPGRANHWATAERLGGIPLTVRGSGWYELLASYEHSAPD